MDDRIALENTLLISNSVKDCTEIEFHTNKCFDDFTADEKILLRDIVVDAINKNDDTVGSDFIQHASMLGLSAAFVLQMATAAVEKSRNMKPPASNVSHLQHLFDTIILISCPCIVHLVFE
jgi:hypothetical protein